MTRLRSAIVLSGLALGSFPVAASGQAAEAVCKVSLVAISGNRFTDVDWVQDYLSLSLPRLMSESDAAAIRAKLMTTEVFTNVETSFEPRSDSSSEALGQCVLKIDLHEKWTLIPVVRGAYGGGTPLRVFGLYDTHVFGRLWTMGAETRIYGSAAPSGVAYWRIPRWKSDRQYVGLEAWRDNRVRTLYDKNDKATGSITTSATMVRGQWYVRPADLLTNRGDESPGKWQVGLDVRSRQESAAVVEADPDRLGFRAPTDITFSDSPARRNTVLAAAIHDDLAVNNLDMDGTRFLVKAGPQISGDERQSRFESDLFRFWAWPDHWNLATHLFAASTTSTTADSQYWLGGLDSIRGIPDGAIHGTRAAYGNVEMRKVSNQWHYLITQPIVFVDVGGAGASWDKARDNVRSSAGAGVRFAIPQVYRLVFRLDYAWSLDRPGTGGICAGFNQFFQPYIPL